MNNIERVLVNITWIFGIVVAIWWIFPIESLKENMGIISSIEYKESKDIYETKISFILTNHSINANRTFKISKALNVGDTVVFDSYGFINLGKIKEIKLSRFDKRYFIFDLHGDDFEVLDENIAIKLKPGEDLYLRLFTSDKKHSNTIKTEKHNFVE